MPTEEPGQIFALIPQIMADIGAVGKNQENDYDHYKFRGIDDVYNAVQPAFIKHGIFCVPKLVDKTVQACLSSQGKPMMQAIITVEHVFYAPDGSSVSATTIGQAMDRGDKAANKAMSAAFKYALVETFCIPTEGDNDTENHSPEIAAGNSSGANPDYTLPPPSPF